MKKSIVVLVLILSFQSAQSFCGFYVAKASSALFNNKSQVILVRDGNYNTITMSNDFSGDVDEFAMVIPVPVVLDREDIKVVSRGLFDRLDAYSAPRMVEYYDENPCQAVYDNDIEMERFMPLADMVSEVSTSVKSKRYGVTIEAQYQVEEYDIMLLSATRSNGLQSWLNENGYQVPEKANEVLKPYIKNNMKFFVVKVNKKKMANINSAYLRPIQISYYHDKFMLPIRLGMANSTGEQDLVVYAMSNKGRLECANYRTVPVPTDRNIPKFVLDQGLFGDFYRDLFKKSYQAQGKNAVFLEYAWNVSPQVGMKCDPCVSQAPNRSDFLEAGVNWLGARNNTTVFFTRLHVRYARENFPQDLLFQETPNQESFQARYVIHHPAYGDLSCEAGQSYLRELQTRRRLEVAELKAIAGWDKQKYSYYINQYSSNDKDNNAFPILTGVSGGSGSSGMKMFFVAMLLLFLIAVGYALGNRRAVVPHR